MKKMTKAMRKKVKHNKIHNSSNNSSNTSSSVSNIALITALKSSSNSLSIVVTAFAPHEESAPSAVDQSHLTGRCVAGLTSDC